MREAPTKGPLRAPWLVLGTIPDAAFPLVFAECRLERCAGELPGLCLGDRRVPVNRGTAALLVAATLTAKSLPDSCSAIWALVAGDTGNGDGSRQVYTAFADAVRSLAPSGVTFHYLLPDVDWHGRVLSAAQSLPVPPLLVADAGFMYAAKMSGFANEYGLFTPDIGELAFLADEQAPHPFYTRNFLLANETMAHDLIARAHAAENTAKYMLVKGKIDRFVHGDVTRETVSLPDVPALESIGGTGDTVTGLVTGFLASGWPMKRACVTALQANRIMGNLANPTPETSVADLLRELPSALRLVEEAERGHARP